MRALPRDRRRRIAAATGSAKSSEAPGASAGALRHEHPPLLEEPDEALDPVPPPPPEAPLPELDPLPEPLADAVPVLPATVLLLPDPDAPPLPEELPLLAVVELPLLVPTSGTPESSGYVGANFHQLKLNRSPLPPVNFKNRS
jgi:hypothetical protein